MPCVNQPRLPLRALCVGRHHFLADHLARFFVNIGVDAKAAVGLEEALKLSRDYHPHVIVCEYELLATLPLGAWEHDELLSRKPLIAVSLTRRPHEAHPLDVNGIGGFLYMPTLDPEAAIRLITAAANAPLDRYVPSLPTVSIESVMETTA
jgi:hypothetical protein